MAAPDDTTPRSPSDDAQPSGPPPDGSDGPRRLRRRIADRWNSVAPVVGKAGLAVGSFVAIEVVRRVLASASTQAAAAATVEEEETEPLTRRCTNHAGGYFVCGHQPCQKKVNPTIMGHDCCGRCWPGRNCLSAAQRDYDGPGSFTHNYFETSLRPGICDVCEEPPEAHLWVYDTIHGDRYPRT
ncbi:hypothetical protein [Streptomyces sp. NPDC005322]|uniref:hypothetical protein n=1 Tax=Streptomyces sp. NPDC005322 TaxID=3157032 RepID=UPI0033BFB24F